MGRDTTLWEQGRPFSFHLYDDWVFHYVFSQDTEDSRNALMAVLNIVLNREKDPITEIILLNPINYKEVMEGKETTLDIKATASTGEIIDIEMQRSDFKHYEKRSLYYAGKLIGSSLEGGEKYDTMKKSIVISFINGKIFDDIPEVHNIFWLRDNRYNRLLTDRLEIHFIELGKVNCRKRAEEMTPVEKLAVYLKYAGDMRRREYVRDIIEAGGEAFQMVEKVFKEVTDDERIREMYWRKEVYEHDQATWRAIYEERGELRGESRFSQLTAILLEKGRLEDLKRCTEDPDYKESLYRQLGI